MELGGNGPFCVMSDADVDKAVNAAIFGKYLHQGQICMMINRMIVHEDVYDAFVEKFIARSKEINTAIRVTQKLSSGRSLMTNKWRSH